MQRCAPIVRHVLLAMILALLAPPALRDAAPDRAVVRPRVDHHVHVLSPTLIAAWKKVGAQFSRPDAFYTSADAIMPPEVAENDAEDEDAANANGAAALDRAVLVPMSHLYGMDAFRETLELDDAAEAAQVRRENDYVMAQAARRPGRTVAVPSVPLLRPYALDELKRCREEHSIRGIKLHLAASGFDPREAEHRARLREVMAWADAESLFVLLHLDPQRRGIETTDIRAVIDDAIAPFPNITISIAHLGGSGGYGEWVQHVLRTFAAWLEEEAERGNARANVFFDISGVVVAAGTMEPFSNSEDDLRALRDDLRRIGLERILFASDFPVFDPMATARNIAERVGLRDDEMARLLRNDVPALWR